METNKKIIYIVTTGEYSDYTIVAVFSTEKKANEYVQQNGINYNVEEFNLDEEVVKENKLWCIGFVAENGIMWQAFPRIQNTERYRDTCKVEVYNREQQIINFFVDADSMDRAVKIARERFAAVKANNYIWLRLTRPYEIDRYGMKKYEIFNVKTNEFIKQ